MRAAKRKIAAPSMRKAVPMVRCSTRAVVTGGRTMVAMPLPVAQMLRAKAQCRSNQRFIRSETGIIEPNP